MLFGESLCKYEIAPIAEEYIVLEEINLFARRMGSELQSQIVAVHGHLRMQDISSI